MKKNYSFLPIAESKEPVLLDSITRKSGLPKLYLLLLMACAFSISSYAQLTFDFASSTYNTSTLGYAENNVGTYFLKTSGGTISFGSTSCGGYSQSAPTSGSVFIFQAAKDVTAITINGTGTGSNRTFSALTTSSTLNGTYTTATATGVGTINSTTCGSIVVTPSTLIPAGTYMQFAFSGNLNVTSIGLTVAVTAPTVTTTGASAITNNAASSGGNVTSDGNSAITARGVVWGLTANPTIPSVSSTLNGTGTGTYISSLTGLAANTTYHIRAYATNAVGTSYGGDSTFTTLPPPTVPVVKTIGASSVTPVSATSGGIVTSNGGLPVTAEGVVWGLATNPTIPSVNSTSNGTATPFTSYLSGLTPSTTYHVRAYATNSLGTAYGGDSTFTTPAPTPSIIVVPNALAFGTVLQGTTSATQSYTLSAYFLNTATGVITVTAPAGYTVSTNSTSGFASTITVPYTANTLTATTIYVRFSPNSLSNFNKKIANSGGGAVTQYVDLTGAIEPVGGQGQQGFSNKGTDFWTGFGPHEKISSADGSNSNALMTLYFTADVASTVTIYVGNNLIQTLNVPAGTVTASNLIPYSGTNDARLINEGVFVGKGIYVHSTNPVVAYAEIYGSQVTAASVLFPVNTLGKTYTALNYTQLSNTSTSNNRSYVFAVATQDNTTVQVTLPAGVTSETGLTGVNTKLLNKGDVWLIKGGDNVTDITGTQVKSISASGSACQPIAVFSGSGKIAISCDGSTPSSDNLFQQSFPAVAWGRKYVSAPTAGTNYKSNIYRVMINPDYASTVVSINGITLPNAAAIPGITTASTTTTSNNITLTNNLYYEFRSNVPVVITATSPVMVAQYITNASKCTNNYTGNGGDPDMVYLSAVEQTIDKIIVSPIDTKDHDATNYINVVLKTVDIPNFSIKDQTNAVVPATFTAIDGTYSYAQIQVATGYSTSVYYNLACTGGGFNAISYGYASSESYAYNAGTNLVDLLSGFNVQNQYNSGASVAACKGSQFYMNITLAFKPVSIFWDFAGNTNLSPNTNVTQTSTDLALTTVLIDSVLINGVWLYTYRIPSPYVYNAVGSFTVKVNAVNPTPDGCNGVKTYTYNINVVQGPTANYTFTNTNGCLLPIQFTDASTPTGTITQWQWDFNDASTSNQQSPLHTFSTGGTYNVALRVITADGCYGDVTKPIALSAKPVAAFTQSTITCQNVAVAFNSSTSTIAPVGTISQWAWNFGDPSSGNNTSTIQNPSHTFANAANYTVGLTVTSSTGCASDPVTKTITVNPTPPTDFTFTNTGCAKDIVTFAGSPNAMTTYAWDFGETGSSSNTSALQNPTHQYASANTYNVTLTATSAQGCIGTKTKPVTLAASLANPVVTVTNVGATSLTFSWTAVAGATGYQVSTDGINFSTPSSGATGLTHVVSGLAANQSITLTVKAVAALACQSTTGNATGITLYPDVGLYIPNTFTPNGDGKNDVLKAYGNYLQKLNMKIFNQWGEKVFETSDVTGGWDGTYKGQQQPVGVYMYIVIAVMPDGRTISKKGSINLIR